MGKASSVVVGYKYFFAMHMGLCRGPVNELIEIKVGDRTAWKGSATGNGDIYIDAPELFGGDNSEGGIEGPAELYFGGETQTVSDKLKEMLGNADQQPDFRGVFTMFYDGLVSSMSPYPKKWKMLCRRTTAGWQDGTWYAAKALIELDGTAPEVEPRKIHAMNPAHIVFEALTNRAWGRGLPRTIIDQAAFRYAADQLYAENFGLCLRWTRTDTLTAFIQGVLDHIAGVLYLDKTTGLYKLKLLRDDYVPSQLPMYTTDSGLKSIDEASSGSTSGSINEIVVTYHNPLNDADAVTRVQNIAAVQATGSVASRDISYLGVPTAQLAAKLAQRDLKLGTTNLRRFKLTGDRRLWKLQPGDLIRIKDAVRGIGEMVLRIVTVEDGTLLNGEVRIAAIQDLFAFRISSIPIEGDQDPLAKDPELGAGEAKRHIAYERPYAEINRSYPKSEFAFITPSAGFFMQHLEKSSPVALGFDITVQKFDDPSYFEKDFTGEFTPVCNLAVTLEYLDTELTYLADSDTDMKFAEVGQAALIGGVEFVRVTSIDLGARRVGIERGTMDTRPHRHLVNSEVWFTEDNGGTNFIEYTPGTQLTIAGRPYSLSQKTVLGVFDLVTMNWRFKRPYCPGAVMQESLTTPITNWFNTVEMRYDAAGYYEDVVGGEDGEQVYIEVPDVLTISWAHRDRVLQADQLIPHATGSIGPEPGTTYVLEVKDSAGNLVRRIDGITGTSQVYTYGMGETDLGVQESETSPVIGYFELSAEREGLASWQGYRMAVAFYKRPPVSEQQIQTRQITQTAATPQTYDAAPMGAMVNYETQTATVEAEDNDISGVYVQQVVEQAATFHPRFPDNLGSYPIEMPYTEAIRSGRPVDASTLAVFTEGPGDRITEKYQMLDSVYNGTGVQEYELQGLFGFSPWVDILGTTQLGTSVKVEVELRRRPDGQGGFKWVPDETKPQTSERVGGYVEFEPTAGAMGILVAPDPAKPSVYVLGEVVEIESVVRNAYGVESVNIRRGCDDSIPRSVGKCRLWILDDRSAVSSRRYNGDATALYKVKPLIFEGEADESIVVTKMQTMNKRVLRPYPPGLMLVNGEHWFKPASVAEKPMELTWAHRNSAYQGETLYDHYAVNIPRAAGVYYVIAALDINGAFLRRLNPDNSYSDEFFVFTTEGSNFRIEYETLRNIVRASDKYRYDLQPAIDDAGRPKPPFYSSGSGAAEFKVYAVRGELQSRQAYNFKYAVYAEGEPPPVIDQPDDPEDPGEGPVEPPVLPPTPDPDPVEPEPPVKVNMHLANKVVNLLPQRTSYEWPIVDPTLPPQPPVDPEPPLIPPPPPDPLPEDLDLVGWGENWGGEYDNRELPTDEEV